MAQLEDPASLARLPDETTRHLVIVLIETGLRANDACALPVNPIIEDSVGWDRLDAERLMLVGCRALPDSLRVAAAEKLH